MKKYKTMTEDDLQDELNRWSKFINEEFERIQRYDDLDKLFNKNWDGIVEVYKDLEILISKLDEVIDKKKLDHNFFGFKYKEEDYEIANLVGSSELYKKISDRYKSLTNFRSSILSNLIVFDHENAIKYLKMIKSGYNTYPKEVFLPLQTNHFLTVGSTNSPLLKAINENFIFFKTKPRTGIRRNYNLPSEINFFKNNNVYVHSINVLTKAGAKYVYEKRVEIAERRRRQIELELRSRKRSKNLSTELNHIYIFSNKSYSNNTFKIGWTSDDPEVRAEQLSSETGVLHPFKVEYSKKFKDAEKIEKKIHKHFSEYRIRKNKEYFEVELDKITKYINNLDK